MIRKAGWMTVLFLVLLVGAVSTGAHRQVATSAQSFQRYFQDLKGAGPVSRFVFSIVLASADPYPAEQQ
jgi:hypothetical protein